MLCLPTAYFGTIHYYRQLVGCRELHIEMHEHFIKQSIRSTTSILSANGVQKLSVPVQHKGEKKPISELKISYAEPWQRVHWQAIKSAYGNSPYFNHYAHRMEDIYQKKFEYLPELNEYIRGIIFSVLKINLKVSPTHQYQEQALWPDYRSKQAEQNISLRLQPYTQTFAGRFAFVPNPSILDLLFNLGPEGLRYLKQA